MCVCVCVGYLQFWFSLWCQQLHKARQHAQLHDLINKRIHFCIWTDQAPGNSTHCQKGGEGWGGEGWGGEWWLQCASHVLTMLF